MYGDLSEGPQYSPQYALNTFKERFFKKARKLSTDIELHQKCIFEPSTSQSGKEPVIRVRNANKSYGTINPVVVLDRLDMTVPRGTIYGLLGASGCGKTTLLSCLIGCKKLNSGDISVLGGVPGSKQSGVPGPRIGYMPQEIGLCGDYNIWETLLFSGRVFGMTKKKIRERYEFLLDLLMLPNTKELLKNLSGGQQRRTSLATALVHEPELLILDEPTVGVDPLVRERIWEYLLRLVKENKTTIIITTHYIEEARQANIIGLMRGGYLLAEEAPDVLLSRTKCEYLEDAFLKLSCAQNLNYRRSSNNQLNGSFEALEKPSLMGNNPNGGSEVRPSSVVITSNDGNSVKNSQVNYNNQLDSGQDATTCPNYKTKTKEFLFDVLQFLWPYEKYHMNALIRKNFIWLKRNIPLVSFITLLPVVTVILFCTFVGRDPVNLDVAVINYESNNSLDCNQTLMCGSSTLSCSYLGYLERKSLILHYYESEDAAREAVLKGELFASIVIPHNYSAALKIRLDDWKYAEPWDFLYSDINVTRDPANLHIAMYLKVYMFECFQAFIQDYLEQCEVHPKVLTLPLQWQEPVYGRMHPNFTDFAIPGILLSICFFVAVSLTAGAMLIERNEGSLDRIFVTGINEIEMMTGHIICELGIMVTQTILVMVCAFYVFNMTIQGSFLLVIVLLLFTGFSGMSYGMVVSCICDRDSTTTLVATGSLLPMMVLGGVIWPVEAMHPYLKPFAYLFPLTYATEGLRNILQKDWGLGSSSVYPGYIIINIWTVIFLVVSIIFLKLKRE